ncbi:hypothetical protein ABTX77_38695 [Streptomyces sp. NPDC097704]|uniref:hypothetical protein n=1 Tax=Streptomyces sp. NPDC097704 TaxID=3157101 RepID=UPI0033336854
MIVRQDGRIAPVNDQTAEHRLCRRVPPTADGPLPEERETGHSLPVCPVPGPTRTAAGAGPRPTARE